jgi:hypothetical protein
MKTGEEKRLAQEVKQKRKLETPGTWEHYKAICKEVDRHAREADTRGTTSETWPPPRSLPCNFTFVTFQKYYSSL